MLDVKKLIAGFLILATGASSSVLIFSYLSALPATSSASSELAANSNPSPLGSNAFVSQAAESMGGVPSPTVTNSPDNLTGNLTDTLLNGVMAANPQGPATDANGNPTMAPPDQAKMLAELSQNAAFKNLEIPDWDADAAAQKLNILNNSASGTVTYAEAFYSIFQKDISQTGIQDVINQNTNPDPDTLAITAPAITDALQEAVQIPTPPNLLNFQKSLIKLLTYEKNALQVAENAANDPIRSSLILQGESKKYQVALDQFKNEVQKNPFKGLSIESDSDKGLSLKEIPNIGKQNGLLAFFDTTLGIPTAHAQYSVEVLPAEKNTFGTWLEAKATTIASWAASNGTWATVGQLIWQYAQMLALQMVKNTLIYFIQNKVLAWIQGSGAPRFITSWATTFVNIGQAAAISALNKITPYVCPSFGPLIRVALTVKSPYAGFQTCTMSTANMRNFYNNFANGGWNSYFTMLQPNNSFYSQLMTAQDAVAMAAGNQQAAAKAQSVASQGFKGDQICADGSNPNGLSKACVDGSGEEISYPYPDGTCDAGETLMLTPNNGLCGNGSEPKTTTPGQTTAGVSAKVLGSNIDLVVSAQNLAGIVAAMITSLMTSLMNSAQGMINGSISQIGTSGGGNGMLSVQPLSVPISSAPVTPISCSPATQTILAGSATETAANILATGGSFDSIGNPPTYTWSAPGANPATSTGSVFTGSYNFVGNHNVSVTASTDNTTATCQVTTIVLTPVSCSPATQTIDAGSSFSVSATDGTAGTNSNPLIYTWSAPSSTPATSTGPTLTGTYSAVGTYNVTVVASTDNTTATCQVTAQQPETIQSSGY